MINDNGWFSVHLQLWVFRQNTEFEFNYATVYLKSKAFYYRINISILDSCANGIFDR